MAKLLKRLLLAAVVLCLSLGIVTVAAACNQTEKEPEAIEYKVTVTCSDLTASELDTLKVQLNKADGTAAADAKQLSGGSATFELAPATYTVVLSGDLLADYTYPTTTVSAASPSATVALSAKSVQPQTVSYTVQVNGASELSGISVKLLNEDGTDATEAKALTNGAVTFDLVPATYKVKLLGDVLENYTYTEPTLTATQTSATVTLTAKAPQPPEGKLFYTVTVTCEATPTILTVISVELHTEDGPLAADAQLLVNGVATFTLDPGTYTVVLADANDMLKNYEYEKDITLTADNPSVTIVLTPKDNEPDGSEEYPFVKEGTLAGDYEFLPVKMEVNVGWDTYTEYSAVFYTYTPASDETYTFTTTVNYLGITVMDESGATVFNNISGTDRFYRVFSLKAGTVYTMNAWADDENAPYKEGDKLTWKIQSGEQLAPDVTYTVNVTCDDAQVTAGLSAQLFKADGTPAADAQALVNGSATFSLPAGTYTVKLSGDSLAGYTYAEATVSQGSPVANIKLVKESHQKSFLSGDGSANSPYIVDPLTGVYSVPTKEFDSVYIEFTATAEGDYILTTEDDSLYVIIDQNGKYLVRFFFEGSDSAHPFHVTAGLVSMEVKNYNETNAPVTFTITRADGSFDPEKAPAKPDLTPFVGTWTDGDGHKIVITENSISYSENDDSYDATIDGVEDGMLKFTHTEMLLGNEFIYHWGLVFDGAALVVVDLDSPGTGKDYFNGYYIFSTLTKQGSAPSVTLPSELTGIWSGYSEDYEATCTLTFDGLNVTYAIEGTMTLPGTVASYDEATHTLTLQLASGFQDMPLELVYDPAAHTLTDEMFGVVLSKQGEVTPVELPEELTGVWTGADDDDMVYELAFDGLNVTFVAGKGSMSEMTFSGKATAYDKTSKLLTITLANSGTVSFVFDPTAMTLTCSEVFPVTLTKQGYAPSGQDGTAAHPLVWDTFEGTLEVDLPAGSDQSLSSIYYSYTAKKNGIYSLSYTLNGENYTDLNLIIYPAGDSAHPVAAWNTFSQAYAFPFTANTTYIFRLTDNSATAAGGKLVLTVTEQELTIVSAYNGKWVDAEENPKFTLEISGTTVTVNGKTVSSLTLAPFNGGYNFIWEGKDCNIAIGRTQTGGYESAMLFTFGDGEKDYVSLYHPGSVPAIEYGTEEHPMEMQQSGLAKSWSDSLSRGEYYWTFTATETKVYTLTTTIDYLCITITDTTADKDIVDWVTSENFKEIAFEIVKDHTYVIFYTDSSSEDGMTFKTVTFKIEEGGTLEKATIPQEILDIEWADATNPKNTITLTADEVKIHVDIAGITSKDYIGRVTKTEQTASGYTITFATSSTNLSLVYNSADKTLTFTDPNSKVYSFTAKQTGGSTWTGTLPDKWSGTWQLNGDSVQSITIAGNTITWTTGAGAGKTFTIIGYDETNMVISFKTNDGLTGTIERQFEYESDTITAIQVTLGGTTYRGLRKAN